jgi:hypothetical protein
VYRVPASLDLFNTEEEEDYPSMAQSGMALSSDDVYLAYTRFVHGCRDYAQHLAIPSTKALPDLGVLARPTGGDQVLVLHYSKSTRTWSGPYQVTGQGEDVMRTAVAVDGKGNAWVFYSTRRQGSQNFDLFARSVSASGVLSPEIQITTDPGSDLWPVAAADSSGRVWVAWQGFRNNNLEILTSVQQGSGFTPEAVVSFSARSNWEPAIAAAANGDVAIAWDTYDKGDYDVFLRRVHFTNTITMDPYIPIATSDGFEARPSIVFDAANQLWVAYEVAGPLWAKDYSAYDTSGTPIFQNHSIDIRVVVGTNVYAAPDDVGRVLPGQIIAIDPNNPYGGTTKAGQMFPICSGPNVIQSGTGCTSALPFTQPNTKLASMRLPGNGILHGGGQANSFPRLGTDGATIYLAYRVFNGLGTSSSAATGDTVGSIWSEQLVYLTNSQWHGPGIFADSDGLLDNRPAMVPLAVGQILVAQSRDHRLSPIREGTPKLDGVNSDIFALELPIPAPSATPNPPGSPRPAVAGTPTPATLAEIAAATALRNYRVTINGQTLQVMRGDFHRHTELSFDGWADGPLVDAYRYGVDASLMNWYSCCDHDNGGAREYSWWLAQKYTDAYLLGSAFVPLFYYERSLSYPDGHRNVMFEGRGIRPLPRMKQDKDKKGDPDNPGTDPYNPEDAMWLYQYLSCFSNAPFNIRGRTAAHTSATSQGNDWTFNPDATYPGQSLEPMVEIYQGDRQNYESCATPPSPNSCELPAMLPPPPRTNTAGDSISEYREKGHVSNALLTKKYVLGFEASSDHVSTHSGFTNIWVTSPTRKGLLDAVSLRHTYASTDYILVDFHTGNYFMGDTLTGNANSPPVFSITLQGTNPAGFSSVIIVKDNTVAMPPISGPQSMTFTYQDKAAQAGTTSYYYVRGLQALKTDPSGNPLQVQGDVVWSSPIWVKY